jgi:hypothetical protein
MITMPKRRQDRMKDMLLLKGKGPGDESETLQAATGAKEFIEPKVHSHPAGHITEPTGS